MLKKKKCKKLASVAGVTGNHQLSVKINDVWFMSLQMSPLPAKLQC